MYKKKVTPVVTYTDSGRRWVYLVLHTSSGVGFYVIFATLEIDKVLENMCKTEGTLKVIPFYDFR